MNVDPWIVAHRGASKVAPENTLAAFRAARASKADMYELDVQLTKDDKLVVIHDSTLERTTNVESVYPDRKPWRVRDFTLEEITKLDAGSWFSGQFAGERVPTLEQVLAAMKEGGTGLFLEVKSPSQNPDVARHLAAVMAQTPSFTVVQSFDWRFMQSLALKGMHGILGTPRADQLRAIAAYAQWISVKYTVVTPAFVAQAHQLGLKVLAYTIKEPSTLADMVRANVDGLLTNNPIRMRWLLKEFKEYSASPDSHPRGGYAWAARTRPFRVPFHIQHTRLWSAPPRFF